MPQAENPPVYSLLRVPLRYDPLTWVWVVLVGGVYVAHLQLDTWFHAWAFIMVGSLIASVAVLLLALLRYLVDGPQARVEGARPLREVILGTNVLPDAVHEPADDPGSDAQPHQGPPRLMRLEVSDTIAVLGIPITITWSFQDADEVVVDDRGGFPSHGQTTVALHRTGRIPITARNAAGCTQVRSAEIEIIPVPAISSMTVTPMPHIVLDADIRATVNGAQGVLARLDQLLAAQDKLRPYRLRPLRPLGVPSHFATWLRGYPRTGFITNKAYLPALPRDLVRWRELTDKPEQDDRTPA